MPPDAQSCHTSEQIARMLPVERGDQLAGVKLVRCQDRHVQLDTEQVAGLGAQRPPFGRQHGAAEHDAANEACLHAERLEPFRDGGQFLVDRTQRFVARRLPREVHNVDVHRQARHVLHEEVDGRAALHGEDVTGEHIGREASSRRTVSA